MLKKLSVGVIFGGRSCESEASIASAVSVLKNINTEKFDVIPIVITKNGTWIVHPSLTPICAEDYDNMFTLHQNDAAQPMSQHTLLQHTQSSHTLIPHIETAIDVIFPLLHGTFGEDGTLQGLLEMANIPYVGCGVLGGALGMDKEKTKQVLQTVGLPVVDYKAYRRSTWERNPEAFMDDVEAHFCYPCFVKPVNGGSSIGVSKVFSRTQLQEATNLAVSYDRKIIVEKAIHCREVECAVLGNEDPQVSVVGEVVIRPECAFYDYHAKYITPSTKIIPADIPASITQLIQEQSIKAFDVLDLKGLARFDFFLEKETNNLYLNEVNTLPSFTEDCMYPKLCEASGIAYPDLLERLIELAVESYEERQRYAFL